MIIKLENVSPAIYMRLCEFLASDDSLSDRSNGFNRSEKFVRLLKARTPDNDKPSGRLHVELEIWEGHVSRARLLKLFDTLDIFPG